MDTAELSQLLSVQGIKSALDPQIYDTLTYENEASVTHAISSAATWAFAKLIKANATKRIFNADETELLKQALEKRAIYELYTRSEVEGSAEDKRNDASMLISALLQLSQPDEPIKATSKAVICHDAKLSNYFPFK